VNESLPFALPDSTLPIRPVILVFDEETDQHTGIHLTDM
jgi:hypothetical protein